MVETNALPLSLEQENEYLLCLFLCSQLKSVRKTHGMYVFIRNEKTAAHKRKWKLSKKWIYHDVGRIVRQTCTFWKALIWIYKSPNTKLWWITWSHDDAGVLFPYTFTLQTVFLQQILKHIMTGTYRQILHTHMTSPLNLYRCPRDIYMKSKVWCVTMLIRADSLIDTVQLASCVLSVMLCY